MAVYFLRIRVAPPRSHFVSHGAQVADVPALRETAAQLQAEFDEQVSLLIILNMLFPSFLTDLLDLSFAEKRICQQRSSDRGAREPA